MAALGPAGLATRLIEETHLHGVVTIAFLIAHLQDGTRADLQHGDGSDLARLVVHLRHADFQTQ